MAERSAALNKDPETAKAFRKEVARFLPNETVKATVNSQPFWRYLAHLMDDYREQITQTMLKQALSAEFKI